MKANVTHLDRETHLCVNKLANIGSDNGLSPCRRRTIIWTSAGILLIRTLGTNFSEILSEIHIFPFKKMHFKMSSLKWRQFCLGLSVLGMEPITRYSGNDTQQPTFGLYLFIEKMLYPLNCWMFDMYQFKTLFITLIPAWISYHMPNECGMKLPIHSQTSTVQHWSLGRDE